MIDVSFDMINYYFAIEIILINVKKECVLWNQKNLPGKECHFPREKAVPAPAYYCRTSY